MATTYITATLVYNVNPTGTQTATQLAATMQAATFFSASHLALLGGVTVTSQLGTVVAGQAVLTVELGINTATFRTRFPSVGPSNLPFRDRLTTRLRALVNQPVLAALPVLGSA